MPIKTYVPGAVDVAQHAHRYLTRWQSQLTAGASTDKLTAFTELVTCLANFLNKWTKPPPVP